MGFVKPNANVSMLVDTAKEKMNKLTKEDTVVFWGGVNDVSKNNAVQGLTQMIDFVSRNQQTYIILTTVPYKFDLDNLSWVKKEVKAYNRKLNKIVNHCDRITLVSAVPEKIYLQGIVTHKWHSR